jgi:hypothetical protein
MKKIVLITLILVITFLSVGQVYADCRGCCSWHGGVCCFNGVTMCCDGSPLSAKCAAKGCDKCPSLDSDYGEGFVFEEDDSCRIEVSEYQSDINLESGFSK